MQTTNHADNLVDGIPLPIVNLSRWVFAVGPVLAMIMDEPRLVTLLLLIDALPLFLGRQWSLVGWVGKLVFGRRLSRAAREDRRIITFNRGLVVTLLVGAQVAFWLGIHPLGWAMALMVAAANGIALAGFCLGCFLYHNFKLYRYRFERGWLRVN